MAKKTIKTGPQKTGTKKLSSVVDAQAGYVRTEAAPLLLPPPSEVGITGWLYKNIFASMSDFGSIGGAIKSILIAFLTVVLLYFLTCLLYTSPSPRDLSTSRMPSSA